MGDRKFLDWIVVGLLIIGLVGISGIYLTKYALELYYTATRAFWFQEERIPLLGGLYEYDPIRNEAHPNLIIVSIFGLIALAGIVGMLMPHRKEPYSQLVGRTN